MSQNDQDVFRFYDNREKYLLFITTTTEKIVTAERVGLELPLIHPTPPAIRIFDAGMGDGTVLSRVLREMHCRFPTIPFLVVGKETSVQDMRLIMAKLADRFQEHPQTVMVFTNMYYREAPFLRPNSAKNQEKLKRWDVPLEGTTAYDFAGQIDSLTAILDEGWQTRTSEKTGNPLYVNPSILVLYRQDHEFALNNVIPREGRFDMGYDLMIAAQPFRARMPASFKVEKILGPLAQALAVNGRMIVIQSTGHDPAMELIRQVWPDEDPFQTPRHMLINALQAYLGKGTDEFICESAGNAQALFNYYMHALPDEISSNIGTSTLLAAWNAAVYVAQIDEERINEALRSTVFIEPTQRILQKHGGLWFQDESFVVTRKTITDPDAVLANHPGP